MRQLIAALEARDGPVRADCPTWTPSDAGRAIAAGEPVHADHRRPYPVLGRRHRRPTRHPHRQPAARDHRPRRRDPRPRLGPAPPPRTVPATPSSTSPASPPRSKPPGSGSPPTAASRCHRRTPRRPAPGTTSGPNSAGCAGSPEPHPEIREHARAVEDLIRDVLARGQPVGRADTAAGRRTWPTPRPAATSPPSCATPATNSPRPPPGPSAALHHLVQTGNLYVPAGPAEIGEGTLTWDRGKPVWTPTPVSPDKIRAVNAAYRQVEAVSRGLQPTPAPAAPHQASPLSR